VYPGPGGQLPSSQIEPSSEARKTRVVIMMLSVEERTFLVQHVFQCGGEHTQDVQQRFQVQFPGTKVPYHNAVGQLIQKFKKTGPVCDATRSGRPSILAEKKVLDILNRMLQSLKKSIRKLSQQVGVSYGMAHTASKKCLCLHLYKITAVHDLKPGDSAKRAVYCKWFLDFFDHERKDILDVTFSQTRHISICQGTSTVKTHVSCVHKIPMHSTRCRCMMRRLVFELECRVGA